MCAGVSGRSHWSLIPPPTVCVFSVFPSSPAPSVLSLSLSLSPPPHPLHCAHTQMSFEILNLRTAIPLSFSPVYGCALSFTKYWCAHLHFAPFLQPTKVLNS